MNLYRKNGDAPQALPFVDLDDQGLSWSDLENNAEGREACGWAPAPVPPAYDPAVHTLSWSDDAEAWVLTEIPPPPEPEPPQLQPIRIGKFWLLERFSAAQEQRFAALEAQARNLTPAQIADPAFEPFYQLQRFLRRLDALSIIELDAPGTLAGFELLYLLGVFGDPASPGSSAARDLILIAPTGREIT